MSQLNPDTPVSFRDGEVTYIRWAPEYREGSVSMSQKSKDVVLAYVAAFNSGDLERLCSLFTPDALVWGVLGWGDLAAVRPIWRDLIECLQIQLHVEAIIAEEDTVAVRYIERGTSARPFRGAPATGRSYELTAMEWFVVRGDRIHRRWGARDGATQAKQLEWDK